MANSLDDATIAMLQKHGYITSQQAANPASIPQAGGQPNYDAPQFAGLHPLANNQADIAAQQQAAASQVRDLRYGTDASGQPRTQAEYDASKGVPSPAASQADTGPKAPVTWQFDQGAAKPGPGGGGAPQGPATATIGAHAVDRVSPEVKKLSGQALDMQGQANEAQTGAQLGQNQAQTQAFERRADDERMAGAIRAMQENDRQKALNAQSAEAQARDKEAASGKLNYNRWWESRSTGQKVVATIAQALINFGSGLTHTQPTQIIDNRIQQDIAEQRDELARKQANAKESWNSYDRMRARFGDDRQATNAEYEKQLHQWELATKAETQASNDPAIRAQGQQLAAQLAAKRADLLASQQQWVPAQTVDLQARAIAQEKQRAELEKMRAETGKTEAETDKLKGTGAANAELAGPAPPSTAWNPLRYVPGTESRQQVFRQDDYNASVKDKIAQKFGARGVEKFMPDLGVTQGMSQDEVNARHARANRLLGGGVPAFQLAPGQEAGAEDEKP